MAGNEITVKLTGQESQDGLVDLDDFARFCQSVAKCLKRSDQILSGRDQSQVRLVITGMECRSAKVKIQVRRAPKGGGDPRKIVGFFSGAVRSIQQGSPDHRLGPDDLQAFKELSTPLRHGMKAEIGRVRITNDFVANIDNAMAAAIASEGFVTGVLDQLNLHEKTEIVLHSPLVSQPVTCVFAEEKLNQIRSALKRNVTVRGILHYRAGKPFPYRVEASSLQIHPADGDLPTLHDVRAYGGWDTGGLSAVEFVRSLREE